MLLHRCYRSGLAALLLLMGLLLLARWAVAAPPGDASSFLPLLLRAKLPTPTPVPTATPLPTPTATPIPPPPVGTVTPNDPFFSGTQWNLQIVRAPEGWRITTGQEVVIAVIDSGVEYTHPDLSARMVDPSLWYDFAYNDPFPLDGHGHGTHVAGIAAAATNNALGIAGVSWGARILPLQVLEDDGSGPVSLTTAAIRYATTHGADVINLSLGTPALVPGSASYNELQSAITDAVAQGIVVVAAAGNCHQGGTLASCGYVNDAPVYPGAMDNVIAVAATTNVDAHAPYSNVNAYVDVAAPGGDLSSPAARVWSTYLQSRGSYVGMTGTSMAAPHVAGLVALIVGERPWLTVEQVKTLLDSSAADLGDPGPDPAFGVGRIDIRHALELAWYMEPTTVPHGLAEPRAPLPARPFTDCSAPHAASQILLRRSAAGDAAARRALPVGGYRVRADLAEWQLLAVPEGSACVAVRALNQAGQGAVAELDPLMTIP